MHKLEYILYFPKVLLGGGNKILFGGFYEKNSEKFRYFNYFPPLVTLCSGNENKENESIKNQNSKGWTIGLSFSASQFDLHGSDYFTGGSGLVLERRFGKGKSLSVNFIELQNVEIHPKAVSWGGIAHRRHFSKGDIYSVTFKKTWRYIGVKIGFWYAYLPVVGLYFGDLNSFYLSLEIFDNLILGEYYLETSPATIGFHFKARDNFQHFFVGAVGFESEAGAIIKYDTRISKKLIFRTQQVYHFRKKVFGIMLGLALELN